MKRAVASPEVFFLCVRFLDDSAGCSLLMAVGLSCLVLLTAGII